MRSRQFCFSNEYIQENISNTSNAVSMTILHKIFGSVYDDSRDNMPILIQNGMPYVNKEQLNG